MVLGGRRGGPSRGRETRRRRGPELPPNVRQAEPAGGSPTVSAHIMEAVASSRQRRGLSLAGVKKALSAAGYDVPRINSRVNQAVRSLVSGGSLLQTAGTGASGSFRINRQHPEGPSRPAPAAAPTHRTRRGGGRQPRRAAPRAKVKKPARLRRKKKPGGGGKRKAAGDRKRSTKATGVRRLGGRLRKAVKEPAAPGADPAAGHEGEGEAAVTEETSGRQRGRAGREEK
ncbi:histone H1.01-like [Scyliorhinus canicula]|uniref:histone H1.01-like n=1 Tax=Scyliorhinus canicula TaxID=7830 RepID=UPI0018F67E9E|nr:histone H1.01-like [Scyliorhinus canicula]